MYVQQLSTHKGAHTEIQVSGIYKYGRNIEAKLKRCTDTHTPLCSGTTSTGPYTVFDLQLNNKKYGKFPITQLLSIPKVHKKTQNVIYPKSGRHQGERQRKRREHLLLEGRKSICLWIGSSRTRHIISFCSRDVVLSHADYSKGIQKLGAGTNKCIRASQHG